MEIWKEGGMMILDYPKIYKEKELIGQGGNQDWFAGLLKKVINVPENYKTGFLFKGERINNFQWFL